MPRMPNQADQAALRRRDASLPIRPDRHRHRPDHQQQQRRRSPTSAELPARRAHSSMPMAITAATSPMRSICSLKLSIACAMKAGACCGSVATLGVGDVRVGVRGGRDLGGASPAAGRLLRASAGAARLPEPAAPAGAGRRRRRTRRGSRRRGPGARRRRPGRSGRGRGSRRGRPPPCACGAGRARAGRPAVPSTAPMPTPARRPRRTSTASQRQPNAPISCRPSRPRPSMTNGNAVPSLSPASPVRPKRRRSRSRRLGDLHVGGEHRVGRRQDAAEQDRSAQRQAQQEHAGGGDAAPP